ncbi:unnamed protein product, partial [Eretmochelys imbricata]
MVPSTTSPASSTATTESSLPVITDATCSVHSDPHYYTFDKQSHTFMGNCTYTLSKLCDGNSTLPYFNVEAANEHRGGNMRVSYVQYVDVDVYDFRITLGKNRVVKVNGVIQVLPVVLSSGVNISFSGQYVMVTTAFGLRVKFNGDHRAEVILSSIYKSKVCGMCGNYNGYKADDFLNPDGEMEANSVSLGNSWQIYNDSSCVPDLGHTPNCSDDEKQMIQSNKYCGLITDPSGPFWQCHSVADPLVYFEDCLYDLCELHLNNAALCNNLQSYADVCQAADIPVGTWRNETFCRPIDLERQTTATLICPCNSHYEACTAACPATCVNPMAPASCSLPCVEGCVCDSGYLLYNDGCVPSSQCGCWHNGKHYPVGSEFWTDDTCSSKCRCPSQGSKVTCSNAACPADHYCGVQNGKPGCYPETYGICRVHNDPHYNTFDRETHHFMGICTYTLAKVCANSSSLPYFNVEAKNEHRGKPTVSYVQKVLVEVYGQHIEILRNRPSQVLVNEVLMTLPVSAAGGSIRVSRSGRYVTLETDFRLRVSYDTDHSVEVKVPTTYFNRTCGMCGNFNGRRQDDYMMPDGQQAKNSNELGNSWRVMDDDPSCGGIPPPDPCPADRENLYRTDRFCGMITQRPGPFAVCHSVINPESIFESCVYDLCALNGSEELLCSALATYADACQEAGVTLPPWRNATFCAPTCSAPNSHYEPCMTACPATCLDRLAPENCSKPCVEGCACNSGFVLSGSACVPEAKCGCVFQDIYYSEGERVVTENCTSRCECLGNGIMTCSELSCGPDEICKIQNGLRGCYPAGSATCHIYGDPHYTTFDGKLHHFQGACNYTVVETCDNSSGSFRVTTRNEHRGSPSWTAINSVALTLDGVHIALRKNRMVYVNGKGEIIIPFAPSPGVQISSSGLYVMVSTDFGLTVKFDGNHRVEVTLPSSFKEKVCGMCGNYNGNAADDFLNPDGVLEPDSTSLGNSWQVSNHSSCPPGTGHDPVCDESDKQIIASSAFCGLLTDVNGPFKKCHGVLDPTIYFSSCVYDQCELQMDPDSLCKSLQSYADACRSRGAEIDAWRNATFCPIDCPRNSHYEACTAACPATCVNPMAPASCSLPCVEGCVCDSGYLLYNDGCVPSSQCGCWHNGKHYPVGSEFWTDDTCSSKCRCPSQGSKVTCSNAACPADHYCGVQNGKPGCYPETYGICRVHNDPHYNTFDRETHHFMGICTYTLAKVCANSSSLPYFNVEAKNEHRGKPTVSYVQKVLVEVYGQHIEILRNRPSQVLVNEVLMTLPVSAAGGSIRVSRSGRYVTLETDFRLRVSYDTDHSVEVKVPTTYFNRTCGMCGNFNGRRQDDYMMPDGQQAKNSNELGNSWRVMDDDPSCGGIPPPDPCPADRENLYRTDRFCGMITQRPGPFAVCHSVINPESIFESCVYDLCALNGSEELLCSALATYADACQEAGVTLPPWRNATFCAPTCSAPNSHYEPCMTACPATCLDRLAPENCSKPCVEGCACNSGFVLSGSACVPEAKCGCVFQDIYYSEGERVVTENCTSRCECLGNGIMTCSELSCGPDEICKIQNGLRGCYPAGSATCHIYGDPHYTTFDGKLHHFQGACNYTVVETCDNSSGSFRVTTRNEHRGSPSWTAINSVALTLDGVHIALRKNRMVYVNGKGEIIIPFAPSPGVQISSSGLYVMVSTDFGLTVKFDGNHRVEVTLPSSFKEKVCGMCGNYNGNAADDFLNPDGVLEPDSTSLGNSWQVSNHSSCPPGTGHDPVCDESDKQIIASSAFCGLLTDVNGPFKKCHGVLDPTIYFSSCVYDQCELQMDPDSLCKSLQSYADACRSRGAEIDAWRNATFCPIDCPRNSHYEACTAACPATCVNPMAPASCSLPCVEGCVCDSGYLLYNDGCVPSSQCGCWHNGKHYPVGSEFWTDDTCSSKCRCPSQGSKVTCSNAACPADHYCGVQNGKPGCYPETYGICRVHNDPHYNTFDRETHHFMGICTYTLAKVCANSSSLPYFNVEAKNEHRGKPTVSYVQKVLVEVYGQHIEILRNRPSQVLVNEVLMTLPVSAAGGSIRVSRSGRYVTLETDFRLRVSYDTDHSVEVKVPTTYFNRTCGMCGNFNGRRQDDYMMPDGQQAKNSNELGNSWRVMDDDPSCGGIPPPDPCPADRENLYRTDRFCGMITQRPGPFAVCHSVINPESIFESCVYDLCALNGSEELLCSALATYADACQEAGVTLPPWRNATFCAPTCSAPNSHYEPCMTACPATCLDRLAPENCSKPCVEGCACNSGFVLSGSACVPEAKCGCVFQDIYYSEGERVVTENCTSRCECLGNGIMTCSELSCGPDEICKIQNGLRGCYPAGSATCHIYGDPHYTTFDGKLHHFQGACNYTVVETCDNSSGSFRVTTRNEHRGSPSWTAINSVALTLDGVHIALRKNRMVYINGALASPPKTPLPGVTVSLIGRYVQITTTLGVQLQFNGDHELFVRVTEKYKGRLCGLCGTYTGTQQDDFTRPDGVVVADANEFGASWRVPDDEWPCDTTILPPVTCTPSEQLAAEERCGILTHRDGPFAPCRSAVPPHLYLESCVYDQCATGGSSEQLCNDLESYAAACAEAGVSLGEWTADTICAPCNMSCSFDTDFCDWTQSVSDSLDWKRHRGPTSSPNTGPSYDHTTGGANDPSCQRSWWVNQSEQERTIRYPRDRFQTEGFYDTDHSVEVKVPTTYFNRTCGMCGNFNGRRQDDYMMPDGQQAKNSNELGNSWRVMDDDPSCGGIPPPDPCPADRENLYRTDRFCGMITQRPGPFAVCHSVINPESIFESCVYDLCALNGSEELLCSALATYADACQEAGVTLPPWRNATFCAPTCSAPNSHYEPCMTACPATCLDRLAPENCSKPCVEGCACNSGFVLSGSACVPEAKCGCVFQDIYYSEGERVVTENCTSRYEICKIQNGLRDVIPPAARRATSTVTHITPPLMGNFTTSRVPATTPWWRTCDNSSGSFRVTTRNEHRGSPSWTAINSVALTLDGVHIALRKNRMVYINGALASPPKTPLPGVTVSLIGRYVQITTTLGVQLQFNGDHELFVRVTEKYKGRLCGLCGTYTGTQQDDFTRPDGVVVADANEFGASWRVPDDEWPCDTTILPPVTCTPSEQLAAEERCGILTHRDGPFAPCRSAVPPHLYLESCVYDQCATGGSSEQLCNDLESYAAACAEAGVSLGEWTADTICAPCNMSCSFDTDFCDWTQSVSDSLDWKRHRGPTSSPNTGPSYDHTTGDGYFIYLQASEASSGAVAHLQSPVCSANGPHCFRFWYHMYGVARTMALRVYVAEGAAPRLVWSETGNKGDRWNLAEVTVYSGGNMQILLEGQRGEDFRSDVAVDDVSLINGYCPGDVPPTTVSTTSTTSTPSVGTTTPPPSPSSESCVVAGDPHYYTFDKQTHHFMGTCAYTLSKLCDGNSTLPYFNVEAANERRGGNTRVSYVQYVDVDVRDLRITLEKGGVVKVNGKGEIIIPFAPSPGVQISSSGLYVMVSTDFGLTVKFDGNHRVEVTLPSSFKEKVCGMCGNYNGNAADDFLNPDGVLEPDSTSLGNSWQVSNHSSCPPGTGHDPVCDESDKQIIASSAFCGLLTDVNGPFKKCHGVLDPTIYFSSCVYDQCELQMDPDSLCKSLQSYADACRSRGAEIDAWRNATFCPIDCPRNSHYEACTAACPATCVNPMAPASCSLPCVEGCVCDSGYLLYNDGCVPSSQCPSQGSKVTCSNAACPADHYCGVQNGKPGCYPETYGICRVHNDPHYNTFDRETHHFMGICTYTLAKVCANSSSLPYFNVEAKNEHRGKPTVSYVQKVLVEVYGQHIEILRNRPSQVLVNEVLMTLPVSAAGGSIRVSRSGRYVTLETDFRLRVSYDTDHSVEVKVPTTYFNRTCGMCGNFNGRRQDDYMMPDGQQAKNSNELGNSWRVMDDDPSCGGIPPPDPCPADRENLYRTDRFCGMITQRPGPFAVCHSVINPESIFESCVYDLCALNGSEELLCSALATYADACQEAGVTLPPWRNATFCAPTCSAPNSHYEPCMTACPATCLDRLAPENCSKPCVEGCACNSGFVLSGSACVPEAKCGCVFQDIYYSEGERVVTENCTSRCECLGNGIMTCSELSCGPDEICKIQNGLRGCYPAGSATCHIYGDPHYTTFDGKLHHFQGACNYTVVETCDNSSGSFRVTTRNEHRGSPSWTAINSVALTLDGVHIALRKNRMVYVNGKGEIIIPFAPSPGVQISSSGLYVMVSTDFGLTVKFDGNHRVEVTLPSSFKEKVCGMCGNYNGNAADDFLNPDGVLEPDSTSLGNSWQVSNHSSCPPGTGHDPVCDESDKQIIASSAFCGLLTDVNGPFKKCHGVLDPTIYFSSCVYDQCELQMDPDSLCKSLQSYADACRSRGAEIDAWRNATFCPIDCPRNSHYEACTAACPATCVNPMAPASCSLPCVEGCVCDSGYLLYNDGCVPSSQCGCWHNGKHYPVGSEFWTDDTCSSKCRCPSQGSKVTCSNAACPADHYCGVQNGKPGCYPETYGICRVHNDPHYNTFDRETHHFMGICTYTLAKVCANSSSLPYFNVEAKNEHRGKPTVSYVQKVLVEVYGQHIEILRNRPSQVLVNEVLMTLPVSAAGGSIRVSRSGRYVTLETDFRLRVSYDTDHSVEVKVPTTYFNRTCGMCGNFNGRRQDDYMMPDGQQAKNSNELGNSWRVMDDDPSCGGIPPPDPCPADRENLYRTDRFCGMITQRPGPFAVCHSVINPESIFESCVYDLCALNGSEELLCSALATYADACQEAGVTLPPWRNATFCAPTCSAPNSHYEPCMTACPATCLDRLAPENCSKPCVEGCACNSGFVLSGSACVPEAKCGCVFQDIYYSEGERVVTENCTSRCECLGNGIMTCSELSCGPDEICKIQNGLRGCYPAGSATCHIYGDPHYTTFDGKLHHFQGACNYTVVETCDNSSGSFRVTTRNEHRGSPSWTAINSVALTLDGVHIALRKNRMVYINGALASPPKTPLPGVTVSLIGRYVQITTTLGVQLQFNGDHELFVRVTEKYKGRLCGLCGTYTGTQQDDFTRPDGVVVADANEFGASWRVPDDEWPCDTTILPPVTCTPSEQLAAEERCGILTHRDGPFAPCRSAVPPHLYLESCVYDQCATGGSSEQLCNDLESYAAACAEAGVSLGEWTADTICAPCNMSCSFDTDFCDWTQSVSDSLDWKRHRGPTSSPNTGPSYDHTTGDGYFIYLQASEASSGAVAHLQSPVCSANGPHCFRFWYHMYGVARTMALRVYVAEGAAPRLVWSETGNKGDRWNLAEVTVYSGGNMQILLEGQRGEDFRSDVAVDDVSLINGYCPGDVPPTTVSTTSTSSTPSVGTTTPPPSPSSGKSPTTATPMTAEPCQTGRATCSASGDPHYYTFDGRVHHFMGNCTYTLSKVCNGSRGLPPFDVSTTNEHRGSNTKVSYVKSVHVDVYGTQISLLKNRKVTVNGTRRNLPVVIENKIKVQISGRYVLLETDFGLWVRFDGNHYVEVSVSGCYKGQLCGLCGNYNGDAKDDNLKPNGSIAGDSTELGESWLVAENNTICSPDQVLLCEPQLESEARKDTACGMITDPTAISCPGGSQYKSCGSRCPSTCVTPSAFSPCSSLPVEGCFCNEGYVLSGDTCVPESSCGCVDENNHYHQLGESWFTHDACTERCTCNSNNNITCTGWACGPLEICGVQDGELGCYPPVDASTTSSPTTVGTSPSESTTVQGTSPASETTLPHTISSTAEESTAGKSPTTATPTTAEPCQTGRATCSASGDPHYYTFDGRVHHFMGNCTYTLSKVCNGSRGLPPFDVSTTNEHRGSNTKVSYVKSVHVDVYGTQISLLKNRKVTVNGTRRNLPVVIENKIKVQISGRYVLLETDFGLWVRFDGNHYVEVSVSGCYKGQLCGLCGNYNGDAKDDNLKPNGSIAGDSTELGESWLVAENNTICSPDQVLLCEPQLESEARKDTACGMITDLTGIFKDCHAKVAPEIFLENCVYDMCHTKEPTVSLCNGLQAYAESCTNAGICREWRNNTLCPISCPAGSQYKSCGSRCPSTCVTPSAFSPCSSLPVEGCFCNEGYVLSGDTCVPESSCGCVDENNHYHQLGESWFTHDACTERCTCNSNNNITCTGWACGPLEICGVQDGELGCYPPVDASTTSSPTTVGTSPSESTTVQGTSPASETTPPHTISSTAEERKSPTTATPTTAEPCQTGRATCSASGDPHYYTFDGRVHHFMGNCTYTLSKVCNGSRGLPPFDVSTTNEHRGSNTKVSYVKSVHVDVYGTQISLLKNRKVTVNGTRRNLPVVIENKIKVQISGRYVLLETDFGLWVRFDGNHYVEVSVSGCYKGQLCGLCGNYNGDAKDDNLKPNGSIAGDSTELGESWLVAENNTICSPDQVLLCEPQLESEARKDTACGMITDPTGIFKDSISCPGGSQYKSCGSRCPSTCVTPSAFSPCSSLPVEGCFCNEGYVLSGDTCVPESSCGCVDENNHYHQLGESWFTHDACTERCTCNSNNNITCTGWACGPLEICGVQDGELGCYPPVDASTTSSPTTVGTSPSGKSPTTATPTTAEPCQTGRATCSASGDPHYYTFDGRVHHFMGNCTYTLSKVCNGSRGLPPFDVSTTNEHRGSNTKVSYVKSVHVDVYGTQISLLKNRKVTVNGTRRNLPVVIENKIKVQISGRYVLLETDFGLWVRFDGNHYVEVSVSGCYKGQLCGLCGNYNGDAKDDNLKPNGSIAGDSTELGESWLVAENNTICSPDQVLLCEPQLESEARKDTACGMITDLTGIFKDCHAKVAPEIFLENCVYDMCHTKEPTVSLCNGLQAYAESCTNAGICREWRNNTLCPISCPAGSQYKSCGSRCPSTCVTPSAFSPCSSLPVEGCFCNEGYVLSGDTCVPESSCGCVDENNHYHQLGESWFTHDACTERCTCNSNNNITCTGWACGPLEICGVQDGELGCYPPVDASTTSSPTTVGTSPSESTTVQGTSPASETTPPHTISSTAEESTAGKSPTTATPTTAEPCQTGRATCSASGDPHYYTFDGRVHHFMGNCTYTLSKVCNGSRGLPPFDVSTTNEHRGSNTKVSYVKSVHVDVYGTQISLLKNRKVTVNGTRRNLPVVIENKIKVQISGRYALLETDFGLWVRFDGNHYVEVSVSGCYKGQLCGLCGNYNGDAKDDNLKPNGSIAGDSTELGESWLVAENNTICSPDQVLLCEPQLESEARKDTACGMITDPTGIFKDCHAKVAPENFLENCVYDMCHTKEPTVSLCNGLQAYAESCTNAGICREWRTNTLCPISCPGGSHYNSCGSRCPSTCVTPSAFSPCSSLPVEGCFCNEGYVLSGDTCVPESSCGCVDENNHYHQLGESWFTHDACTERCTCNSNNNITCTGWACGVLEKCGVQDGELGCYSP